jgi:calcineurin-like phosphoesterase family protein
MQEKEVKNIWFTSDQHYGHANVVKFCNRPFYTVNDMNEHLIHQHNSLVKPNDDVYMVGDFSNKIGPKRAVEFLKRLNGKKYLVKGNHDKRIVKNPEVQEQFEWIKDIFVLDVPDKDGFNGRRYITLCHYAMRVWYKSHWGTWHLYGHSHGKLWDDPQSLSFDVGVDCHNFQPINYETVKDIMNKKNFTPLRRDR